GDFSPQGIRQEWNGPASRLSPRAAHTMRREMTRGCAMDRSDGQRRTRDRFLAALAEATYPLQQSADDPEVALELLIQAADMVKARLQAELEELRQEEAD